MAECKNCGYKLIYDPKTGKLCCKSCGASFDAEEIDDINRELLEDREPVPAAEIYGGDESYMDCNVYTCEHCGADIVMTDTEASTYCIYCGNPSVVFSRVARRKRPDLIIPFTVTKEKALEDVKKRIRSGRFIPPSLKMVKIEDIRGIYIPFWMAHVSHKNAVFYSGIVKEGRYNVVKYYERAGSCELEHLLADASRKLNDDSTLRLEPYNMSSLVNFDEDYLSGFYSDMPDVSSEEIKDAVSARADYLFIEKASHSINADKMKVLNWSGQTSFKEDPKYVMLPVWFVTFEYKGKPHTVLVNGSSGKIVCALPWSKPLFFALVLTVGLLIAAAAAAALYGLMYVGALLPRSGKLIGSAVGVILAAGITGFVTGIAGYKNLLSKMKLTQSAVMMDYVKRRQG